MTEKIKELEEENYRLNTTAADVLTSNRELRKEKKMLVDKLMEVKSQINETADEKVREILSRYFTPGQIRIILTKKKRLHRSGEDTAAAISLRVSTLRIWATKIDCIPEILNDVILLIKLKVKTFLEKERVYYDEMHVSNLLCFDTTKENSLGPNSTVQVFMSRVEAASFLYNFDTPMTANLLRQLIIQLESIKYPVLSVTSDMGGSNRSVWKELGVSTTKSSFNNPHDDSREVFMLSGGKIQRTCIQKLLHMSQKGLKMAFKITQQHLDVSKTQRKKVKTATQLSSNITSKTLTFLGERNLTK
uniref:Transposable element P transposase-like GTP-binding insertion domain-containing protein n=1 Tax=Timema genevievae TaxID=629358 RepID=A0A7R9PSS1_TIMGE|nr:unnamed protein product [Timema genevievae]